MKQIYIFLDIDGVLNNESAFILNYNLWKEGKKEKNSIALIDEQRLIILNEFCQILQKFKCKFKIIISSTWGHSDKLLQIISNRLKKYNLEISGITPSLSKERGYEIENYCLSNNISKNSIVIFDDDADMGHYKDRLIQTYVRDGLTFKDIERALVLLGFQDSVWNPERFLEE